MKSKQNAIAVCLMLALAAAGYGLYETGRARAVAPNPVLDLIEQSDSVPTSDRSALETVQALAKLPTTAEEIPLAQEALRIADKEMDLAFASAVRRATLHPRPMTAEAKSIAAKLQQAQAALATDQADVTRLTASLAGATAATRGPLSDQLALAQARLELAQDQADDARQDLIRAGGDPQGRVQAMIAEHDAESKSSDSTRVVATAAEHENGLVHRATAWWTLHQKQAMLAAAKHTADSSAAAFAKRHQALESAADRATPTDSAARRAALNHAAATALVQRTVSRAADQKTRSTLDQRVDDQRRLSDIYAAWMGVVSAQQRGVINEGLRGVAVILVIALFGLFFDKWLERLLATVLMDRRSRQTMRTVIRVSLQVMGVLLTLLVIFGEPSNLGTFLGLAGAGLTVALKDFIVGFFGWFVLMGRNGIRIGDLVEINDVTGEVVELGMFHTVLLETGDWSDSGHPTGRRVTFMNSFAIEGHYFDFSTSGQWLWEEVQFVVPAGRDPYPIVDAIQHEVEEATGEKAKQAEEEWRRAAHSPSLGAITAAPAINIKPIVGGVEITVRYITHATERHQLRSKLYHTAIELLGEASVVRGAVVGSSYDNLMEITIMTKRIDLATAGAGVYKMMAGLEAYMRSSGLERPLLELVKLSASYINGCAYCIDMHTKDARAAGETEQRLFAVPVWPETPFFTARERAALAWTEAVTKISRDGVPDEVYAEATAHFSEKELADLTLAIVTINGWNRFSIAFHADVGSYRPPAKS